MCGVGPEARAKRGLPSGHALSGPTPVKITRVIGGAKPLPAKVDIDLARAAVNGVVRTLALEVAADGISVNAVGANFIQTETYYPKALLEDPVKGPRLLARVPMGRLGEAEEVAALIELLAMGRSGGQRGRRRRSPALSASSPFLMRCWWT